MAQALASAVGLQGALASTLAASLDHGGDGQIAVPSPYGDNGTPNSHGTVLQHPVDEHQN